MDKILVSGCLMGLPIRYDGQAKSLTSDIFEIWNTEGRLISVCPEILGGLPTPRPPAEIQIGKDGESVLLGDAYVKEQTGQGVTTAFLDGANLALRIAKQNNCKYAILTDGSPSCGSTFIYDGTFTGKRIEGYGVFAALLRQSGISVFSHTQISDLQKRINLKTE